MEQENKLAPRRKTSKFKIIVLPIIIAIVILSLLISLLFWIFSGASSYFMSWRPEEITFYSQIPINDYNNDDWFDNPRIDGGFNDSVYDGSLEYSKYKNNSLKEKSSIGIGMSLEWSTSDSSYINEVYGIDAQYAAGAKTVVTAGFNLASAFQILHDSKAGYSDEDFMANGWKSIVLDDYDLAMNNESAISVYYEGADAGFLAGIAASVYTTAKMIEAASSADPEVETKLNDDIYIWGGAPFNTVYEILSGFEQGVNYFNYKVMGVDVEGNLYEATTGEVDADSTLGLISKLGGSEVEDLNDGLDINNGYGLTPDYTKSANNGNNSAVIDDKNYQESWYAGTFDTDIGTLAGKAANERAENAVAENTAAVFPVAGGQYTNVASVFSNHSNEIVNSKVIGVDVDGTKSDSSNSEYYLGSAIKNIKDSASLAIWKADGEKGNPTFGGIKASDFESFETEDYSKGWKVDSLNGIEPKGELYKGTYQNGGVGFTEGIVESDGKTTLESSYEYLVKILGVENAPNTFKEYAEFAYLQNLEYVGEIEKSSTTFTASGTESITDSSITKWIPNWKIYN